MSIGPNSYCCWSEEAILLVICMRALFCWFSGARTLILLGVDTRVPFNMPSSGQGCSTRPRAVGFHSTCPQGPGLYSTRSWAPEHRFTRPRQPRLRSTRPRAPGLRSPRSLAPGLRPTSSSGASTPFYLLMAYTHTHSIFLSSCCCPCLINLLFTVRTSLWGL